MTLPKNDAIMMLAIVACFASVAFYMNKCAELAIYDRGLRVSQTTLREIDAEFAAGRFVEIPRDMPNLDFAVN